MARNLNPPPLNPELVNGPSVTQAPDVARAAESYVMPVGASGTAFCMPRMQDWFPHTQTFDVYLNPENEQTFQPISPRIPGLPKDSAMRKEFPIGTGVVDYFPAALAEIAHISWCGNQKHNPGEPLHHARGKSMDHADCEIRHMIERGTWDTIEWTDAAGVKQVRYVKHSAAKAWRALAELQQECEDEGAPKARAAI